MMSKCVFRSLTMSIALKGTLHWCTRSFPFVLRPWSFVDMFTEQNRHLAYVVSIHSLYGLLVSWKCLSLNGASYPQCDCLLKRIQPVPVSLGKCSLTEIQLRWSLLFIIQMAGNWPYPWEATVPIVKSASRQSARIRFCLFDVLTLFPVCPTLSYDSRLN